MIEPTKFDSVEAHHQEIVMRSTFLTVAEVAERWRVSETTVRDIPYDELPYFQVGRGKRKIHRRYRPSDLEEFERRGRGKG